MLRKDDNFRQILIEYNKLLQNNINVTNNINKSQKLNQLFRFNILNIFIKTHIVTNPDGTTQSLCSILMGKECK